MTGSLLTAAARSATVELMVSQWSLTWSAGYFDMWSDLTGRQRGADDAEWWCLQCDRL